MPLLIAALLGLSAAIVVLYPLFGLDRNAAAESAGPAALSDDAERERSAKLALRDVNFDYRLGNLDDDDYADLRDRYERRALAAMKTRYEREQALDELIDRQLEALGSQTGPDENQAGASGDANSASARERRDGTGVPPATFSKAAVNGTTASQTPRVRRRRGQ